MKMFFTGRERIALMVLLTVVAVGTFVLLYLRQSADSPNADKEHTPFYREIISTTGDSASLSGHDTTPTTNKTREHTKLRHSRRVSKHSAPVVRHPLTDTVGQTN